MSEMDVDTANVPSSSSAPPAASSSSTSAAASSLAAAKAAKQAAVTAKRFANVVEEPTMEGSAMITIPGKNPENGRDISMKVCGKPYRTFIETLTEKAKGGDESSNELLQKIYKLVDGKIGGNKPLLPVNATNRKELFEEQCTIFEGQNPKKPASPRAPRSEETKQKSDLALQAVAEARKMNAAIEEKIPGFKMDISPLGDSKSRAVFAPSPYYGGNSADSVTLNPEKCLGQINPATGHCIKPLSERTCPPLQNPITLTDLDGNIHTIPALTANRTIRKFSFNPKARVWVPTCIAPKELASAGGWIKSEADAGTKHLYDIIKLRSHVKFLDAADFNAKKSADNLVLDENHVPYIIAECPFTTPTTTTTSGASSSSNATTTTAAKSYCRFYQKGTVLSRPTPWAEETLFVEGGSGKKIETMIAATPSLFITNASAESGAPKFLAMGKAFGVGTSSVVKKPAAALASASAPAAAVASVSAPTSTTSTQVSPELKRVVDQAKAAGYTDIFLNGKGNLRRSTDGNLLFRLHKGLKNYGPNIDVEHAVLIGPDHDHLTFQKVKYFPPPATIDETDYYDLSDPDNEYYDKVKEQEAIAPLLAAGLHQDQDINNYFE